MSRISRLLSFSIGFAASLSTIVASAQHVCPNCGRHLAHQIEQTNSTAPMINELQTGIVYQQPANLVQRVQYHQPVADETLSGSPTNNTNQVYDTYQMLAERSANYRASRGMKGHGISSGHREGVGWSTRSAADAIRQCCYSTTNLPRRVSVVRGSDGWYATTIYLR